MSKSGKDGCLVPFKYALIATMTAGISNVAMTPSSTSLSPTRLPAAADEWAHFRVRRFRFRLHPLNAVNNAQCAGYVGGVQDTPPGAFGAVSELLPSTVLGADTTIPSSWVDIPKEDLAGCFPWYKTVPGGADPTEEQPGSIQIAGTGTDVYLLEMEGVFEFKTAVGTGNTPEEVALRLRLKEIHAKQRVEVERTRALRLIQGPQQNCVVVVPPAAASSGNQTAQSAEPDRTRNGTSGKRGSGIRPPLAGPEW
jgi:hypothetical protein